MFNEIQSTVSFDFVSSHMSYDENILWELMKQKRIEREKSFENLDMQEKEMRLKTSENNFCWDGVIDYTQKSTEEKQKIIYNSRIINETFLDIDSKLRGGSAAGRDNAIPVLFRRGVGANNEICLNVCSCASSTVAFWVGIGILEIREDKIIPRIISKKQFEKLREKLLKVRVDIEKLTKINENYSYIYIFLGKLNF